jgi:hypothetical protein
MILMGSTYYLPPIAMELQSWTAARQQQDVQQMQGHQGT